MNFVFISKIKNLGFSSKVSSEDIIKKYPFSYDYNKPIVETLSLDWSIIF